MLTRGVDGRDELVDQVGIRQRVVTGEPHHPVGLVQVGGRLDEPPEHVVERAAHDLDPDGVQVAGDALVVLLGARRDDDLVSRAARSACDQLDERHTGDREHGLAGETGGVEAGLDDDAGARH